MFKPVGFLQKKEQEESKRLALVSYEHHLMFAYTHNGSCWCVKCQELFFVLFWPISVTWILNMAIKDKSIPPSKGKPNKTKRLLHAFSWLWIMNVDVIYTEEGKKCLEKAEGEIITFGQQDMSVCPHVCHITWQKSCPHSWPIFLCKHGWHTIFEKTAPKVLKHKINYRAWISTNWKVTMVALPGWLFFGLFLMCHICIHACAHTHQYCSDFSIHTFCIV